MDSARNSRGSSVKVPGPAFSTPSPGRPGYADVSCSEAGGHSHRASGPGYIMVVCVDRALGINAEVRSSHAVRYFELLQRSRSRCK